MSSQPLLEIIVNIDFPVHSSFTQQESAIILLQQLRTLIALSAICY